MATKRFRSGGVFRCSGFTERIRARSVGLKACCSDVQASRWCAGKAAGLQRQCSAHLSLHALGQRVQEATDILFSCQCVGTIRVQEQDSPFHCPHQAGLCLPRLLTGHSATGIGFATFATCIGACSAERLSFELLEHGTATDAHATMHVAQQTNMPWRKLSAFVRVANETLLYPSQFSLE